MKLATFTSLVTLITGTAAAPVSYSTFSNSSSYAPIQYLNGSQPLPKTPDHFNLGEVTSDLFQNITKYASIMSLVDCATIGTIDAGREIFHVLTDDVKGFFMKDTQNKELWAVFGNNPVSGLETELIQYIPKVVADGVNKIDFSCPNCMVQEAQMLALDVVIKDLPLFLREIALNPDYSIYIAGQAFGAGVAALSGNEVSLLNNAVNLVTFGAVKFADVALSRYMDEHYGKSIQDDLASYNNNTYLRVTTDGDPTPLYPISLPDFAHSGTNVHITKNIGQATKMVFRGEWTPQLDALIIETLSDSTKSILKAAKDFFDATVIPSVAIFLGNLLCPKHL